MKKSDEAEAKDLFLRYEGSRFYMSRDGVEESYKDFNVPAELEAEWLDELTQRRLQALDAPGNWKVLQFLTHHGETRYLGAVLAVGPQGDFKEKCSYVEQLIKLLKVSDIYRDLSIIEAQEHLSVSDQEKALEVAGQWALELQAQAQDAETRQRVERMMEEIQTLRAELARSGALHPTEPGWFSGLAISIGRWLGLVRRK